MCGIIGAIGHNVESYLKDAVNIIGHRGPDNTGFYSDSHLALGHTRLSIQDLSPNGNQPMSSADGRYIIIFNGEIYNHHQIRNEFLSDISFKSNSDTETLLYGYIKLGKKILNQLNGIFAFAIYDTKEKKIVIARDQFGVKPLYYYQKADLFLFGSELKSFLSFNGFNKDIEYKSFVNYLYYLWSPGEITPFKNVKKLEAGQYLEIDLLNKHSDYKPVTYYEIPFNGKYLNKSESELIALLEKKLFESIERQMISDVPVGFFLSGGLDSSAIVAIVRALYPHREITCFTIQNEGMEKTEGFSDDFYYAQKVAKHLKVKLEVVKSEINILNSFDEMIWHLDEPQADPAPLHVLNISKRARELGFKVLMGGTGGDDIFSGYRRHIALNFEKYFKFIPPGLGKLINATLSNANVQNPTIRRTKKLLEHIGKNKEDRMLAYYGWLSKDTIHNLFTKEANEKIRNFDPSDFLKNALSSIPEEKSDLNKMLYWELKSFLVDHNLNYTDKMSMATGVEVRVPLLDKELIEFSTQIPPQYKMKNNITKYLFKKVMEKYLPHDVIYRPKTGFGAPVRKWITNDLEPVINEKLSSERIKARGIFNPNAVHDLISKNKEGKIDASYSIWALLAIESWLEQFASSKTPSKSTIV